MNLTRISAAWLMSVAPAQVQRQHVMHVYFGVEEEDFRDFQVNDDKYDLDTLHVSEEVLLQPTSS